PHAWGEIWLDRIHVSLSNAHISGRDGRCVRACDGRLRSLDCVSSLENDSAVLDARDVDLAARNHDWNRIGSRRHSFFGTELRCHLAKHSALSLEIDSSAIHRYSEMES